MDEMETVWARADSPPKEHRAEAAAYLMWKDPMLLQIMEMPFVTSITEARISRGIFRAGRISVTAWLKMENIII